MTETLELDSAEAREAAKQLQLAVLLGSEGRTQEGPAPEAETW